jgi:hypothetical protein
MPKNLNYDKHYINKSHTKHYYMNHIFDNMEWREFCSGITIQGLTIGHSDKHRIKPELCERWYNQDNHATNICKPCKNKVFYRSSTGGYFCKSCAHDIARVNDKVTFDKIT